MLACVRVYMCKDLYVITLGNIRKIIGTKRWVVNDKPGAPYATSGIVNATTTLQQNTWWQCCRGLGRRRTGNYHQRRGEGSITNCLRRTRNMLSGCYLHKRTIKPIDTPIEETSTRQFHQRAKRWYLPGKCAHFCGNFFPRFAFLWQTCGQLSPFSRILGSAS